MNYKPWGQTETSNYRDENRKFQQTRGRKKVIILLSNNN